MVRVAAIMVALAAAAAVDPAYWTALRTVDGRMGTIAYRLTTANAALCREVEPTPGLQLHAIDQYAIDAQPGARRAFGFARPVQVEAVAPGSPAAAARIAADDALLAVGDTAVTGPAPDAADTSVTRDAAQALIAVQPAGRPLTLTVEHRGVARTVVVPASPGCRSAFEVLLGPGMTASSDGRVVQVSVRFFERYDDAAIAAIVAHELSHTILRHRARLEAAGVHWGLAGEFGRNARLFRRTEDDADRLSVHLLRNAGYDPGAAVAFWRAHGGEIDAGLFRSPTHPSPRARADALAAEVAILPPPGARDDAPAVLATRDQSLR
ncbi:M48 family metallopeptidase [Sphingomonas sp.]|uniref:M48 family metallopeptidase n=1 Tax=Sphingomonas sp. TaxID=28214 RepID=UPI003CC69388